MYIIALIWVTQLVLSFCDKSSSNDVDGTKIAVKYSAVRGLFGAGCAAIIALISGGGLGFDFPSFLCAFLFGIAIAVDLINYLFLAKTGMVALLSVINQAASLIMPTVAGILFFSKPVSPIQWLFVLTLLVAIYILCVSSRGIYRDFSFKTVIMVVIRFLAGGFGTISMQTFAEVGNGNTNLFLAVSYLISAVLFFAIYPFIKAENENKRFKLSKRLIVFSFLASALVFGANLFTVMAARVLDPIIQFSLTAVGGIVLNLLLGAICFKEKITVKSVVAIIIAAISVVMINYFN